MPDLTLASSIAISNEVEKFQKRPMDRVGGRLNYPAGPMPE